MATTTAPKPRTAPTKPAKGTAVAPPKLTAAEARKAVAVQEQAAIDQLVAAFKAADVKAAGYIAESGKFAELAVDQRVYMVRTMLQLSSFTKLHGTSGKKTGFISKANAAKLTGVSAGSLGPHFKALAVVAAIKETIAPDAEPQPKERDAIRAAWGMDAARKAAQRAVDKANDKLTAKPADKAVKATAEQELAGDIAADSMTLDAAELFSKLMAMVETADTDALSDLHAMAAELLDAIEDRATA